MNNAQIRKEKEKRELKKKMLIKDLLGYAKTVAYSLGFAFLITIIILFHARSEMIKNLQTVNTIKIKLQREVAKQIISENTNLEEALKNKNSTVCMHVGELYEATGDYKNAQYAYEQAVQRAKPNNYKPYNKLIAILAEQEKFDEAENIIKSIQDVKKTDLIKFKTRAYIILGDKYYSISKFLKAATNYEQAKYYYDRFTKNDPVVVESLRQRIVNSYIKSADVIVEKGYNSDAARFLKKALALDPDNFKIKYKLAIIYADLDPIISVQYFEPLLEKMPQNIDYTTYGRVLMKAANIEDIQGNSTKAKYYRYRIHSIDLFVNNKVVYKDDIEIILKSFDIKKIFFRYRLKIKFKLRNVSPVDIYKMSADFVLKYNDKEKESKTIDIVTKNEPLFSNGDETKEVEIVLGKNIFTRKELSNYTIDIYLYKDKRYKTLMGNYNIPGSAIRQDATYLPNDINDFLQ